MGYLRCDACGAKALSAASTCPSCHRALDLYDAGGRRVALRRCAGCALMHRVDRPCPTCGHVPVSAARPWALRAAAVAGVAATLWMGASLGGGMGTDRSATGIAGAGAAIDEVATDAPRAARVPEVSEAPSLVPPPPTEGGAVLALAAVEVEPDSATWQPAVARTWVNVRSDASPNGAVVGVISPDSHAMLGTTRRGWRRVSADDVSGWVDPRLFASASAGG
jgi:hypothetical protein